MGISVLKWMRSAVGTSKIEEVTCRELMEAGQEYRVRELAFWCCTNMIANAVGRCDFRTFLGNRETHGMERYLWNVEPNVNQNSTAFLHKLVAKLYQDNETLVIPTRRRDGMEAIVVADDWQDPPEYPSRQNEYKGVIVGQVTYDKTFRENEVLHLKLNYCDIGPVLCGLYESYATLLRAAMNNYTWTNGQHWKVTVDQMTSGQEGWNERFNKMIEAQIRPFLTSGVSVLPETSGYKYENMSKSVEGSMDATHIRNMVNDIFDFTANAFQIPPVLLRGQVEGTADAVQRFMTNCIDPLTDQLAEEINRKRYGYEAWQRGDYIRIDTSAIQHFNLFDHAESVEKLIGSGYSYNDVQKAAGGQEIDEPWANEHFLTKNFAKAEELLKGDVNE